MKSILDKKIIRKSFYKRLLVIGLIFLISIVALKHLQKTHPIKEEAKPAKDIEKSVEIKIEKPKKPLTVKQKKQRFKNMLVPAVQHAYAKLNKQYKDIKKLMQKDPKNPLIESLKEKYKAKTNDDLLLKLKPHPKSVTLAQAAIESAWGTSRFFEKANNVFGVWSFNKNEPRIAAGETRGAKTIFLKKYKNIEDSVLDYYKILSKAGAYHKFRVQNYKEPNPYKLVKLLDSYSEKRAKYGKILASVISHNKFTKYDEKFYPKPPKPKKVKPKEEVVKNTDTNSSDIKEDSIKNIDQNTSIKENQKENIENIDMNSTKKTTMDTNSTKNVDKNTTLTQ